MANEINTELFVELSEEQQQLVAGGYSYEAPNGNIVDIIHTDLSKSDAYQSFNFDVASTPYGSVVSQDYKNMKSDFETNADKYFSAPSA
jgi:hypothetical protein